MHSLRKSCCSGVPVDERRQAPRSNPAFLQTSGDCFVAIAPRNDEFDRQNCPDGQITSCFPKWPVQPLLQKYFVWRLTQISSLIRTVLSHRGACARHERGAGCGGRGSARDERGLLAYGEVVWFRRPDAGV